jgi:hypothetical protein
MANNTPQRTLGSGKTIISPTDAPKHQAGHHGPPSGESKPSPPPPPPPKKS